MIDGLNRLLGLNQVAGDDWAMAIFAAIFVALLAGMLVDWLNEQASFGVYGNSLILLAGTMTGLVGFARYVAPLRHAERGSVLAMAVASAVGVFLLAGILKARSATD